MTPTLLARRPILDADGRLRGHELQFQDGGGGPSERATARLLLAGLAGHELSALSGGVPAWISVSREFLLTFDPLPLVPGTVVLVLEPDPLVDEELLERLRALTGEGHALALDDVLPRPEIEPLLALASYVRVDLDVYGVSGLRSVVDRLPDHGPALVATNVKSGVQRDGCVARGVALMQGFWFAQPRRRDGTVPVGSIDRLRKVVALRDGATFEDVERVVADDPGLTVGLLRFANSAAVGSRRRFATVRDALMLLGARRVRQFALLVLLSDLGQDRPALVASSVLRGRLCEALAREHGGVDGPTAFTAGVLSTVDALVDQRLFDVLRGLPITEELRWALLGHTGPLGQIVDQAIRLEQHRAGAVADPFTLGAAVVDADRMLARLV